MRFLDTDLSSGYDSVVRTLLTGMLLAVTAGAQTYEILGTVSESGIGGVAGATVRVTHRGDAAEAQADSSQAITDARGAFRIVVPRPGTYAVERIDGPIYFTSSSSPRGGPIRLNEANPRAQVNILVERLGRITGMVLDEETRAPVSNFALHLYTLEALDDDGSPIPEPVAEGSTTDPQGRFTLTDIRPGQYVIGTRASRLDELAAREPGISAPAMNDSGYAESFWPGGASQARAALPIRLGSGITVDAGTILLRKVKLLSIGISIPTGDCPEGEAIRATLMQPGSLEPVKFTAIRCGGAGVMRGLDPGSYLLYGVNDEQGENTPLGKAVWGTIQIQVTDKDEEATLVMRRGIALDGRIVAANGVTLGKDRLNFASRPADLMPNVSPPVRPPPEQFVERIDDNTFRMMVYPGPQEIVYPISDGDLYVREVRYNGAAIRNDIVPVSTGSGAHNLEIVFDDKPTVVGGTVLDSVGNAAPAVVVLANPTSGFVISPYAQNTAFSQNGQFRIPATPGDYAVFAVSLAQRDTLEDPTVYKKLAAAGQKVRVDPGVSQTLTLRLSDPTR